MDVTRIVELFIDDDFEDAGIEAISLVSRPAHEENWQAFNKDCGCNVKKFDDEERLNPYHIVSDDFCSHNPKLKELGEEYSTLINEGWEIIRVEKMTPTMVHQMNQQRFSSPNEDSILDKENYRVRYKYIGPKDNKNRQFCSDMLSLNRVYRIEDIDQLTDSVANEQFGFYNIFLWRGSFNCRHQWVRLIYARQGSIRNTGTSTRGVIAEQGLGPNLQPNTVPDNQRDKVAPREGSTYERTFGKQKFAISIDFDDTLSTQRGQEMALDLLDKGEDLHIITRRNENESADVYRIADKIGIPKDKIHFTNGKLKWELIKKLGITKHIDNNPDEIDAIKKNLNDVEAVKFGLEDACWEGYEAIGTKIVDGREVPNCVPIKMSEDDFADTISDYPEGVKEAAKKVLNYVEKNGWGSCGTDVGKQRANQLAKGENISIDTVKRMYSYLSRHKKDLQSSKSYDDGCGKIMYDAWGGEAGLTWSERKLNQLQKQKMIFAFDEDKKIIIGAAMVPNKMIHRYDDLGNLYYVFFSKQSIKKMADKFLKEKRTDETSIEHDGVKLGKDKVYITESWVSEDPIYDKSNKYGFELPSGTWFVSMKVQDDKIWKMIKKKALNGFSVEGLFAEKSVFSKEDKQINQIKQILKSINDE